MSVFKALGWLLGVPPVEQREYSRRLKEDESRTILKLVQNAKAKLDKYCEYKIKIKSLSLGNYIQDLINSFPISYSWKEDTRLSINSNTYDMFEKIVFEYVDDLISDLSKIVTPKYLNIGNKTVNINSCTFEQKKELEPELKKLELENLNYIKNKHIQKWSKRKTVEELNQVLEKANQKNQNNNFNRVQTLDNEKRILELEKQIRDLKNNNRERQR